VTPCLSRQPTGYPARPERERQRECRTGAESAARAARSAGRLEDVQKVCTEIGGTEPSFVAWLCSAEGSQEFAELGCLCLGGEAPLKFGVEFSGHHEQRG
jgi:hypothetical protein